MADAVDDVRGSQEIVLTDRPSRVVPWALDRICVQHHIGKIVRAPEVTEHPRDVNQRRQCTATLRHHHSDDSGELGCELIGLASASGYKCYGRASRLRG